MTNFYRPLYGQDGGPAAAFACGQCQAVTRTLRGVKSHLWRRHKLKEQMDLPREILWDCSICRRPVYQGKPHDHPSE